MERNKKGLIQGRSFTSIVLVLLFLCSISPAFALPDKPSTFTRGNFESAKQYLKGFIEDWMDDESVPGMSLTLVDGNKVLWSRGFGYADMDKGVEAKASTVYRIGGVTTLFTAVAIMQLIDQGKFDLDEPLKKLVPEYTIKSHWTKNKPITIRQLLSHHAGLPIALYKGMWSTQPEGKEEFLQRLSQTYTSYRPGEVYAFSNIGYVLLGMVIENVSGMSYPQYIQKNIIEPLGLKNTGFELTGSIKSNLATGYKKDEAKKLLFPRDVAAMGLYSTTEDIAKFLSIFYGDSTIISARARQAMIISHYNPEVNLGREVGFAWNMDDKRLYKVQRIVHRWGSTLMYRARVMYLPDYNLGVVVMANSSKGFRAIDEIAVEILNVALEVKEGIRHDFKKKQDEALPAVEKPAQFVSEYASLAGYATIKADENDYIANILGWDVRLKPVENNWYSAQYDLLGVLPIKLDWFAKVRVAPAMVAEESSIIVNYNGLNNLFASELAKYTVSEAWLKRAGDYQVANGDELTEFYKVGTGRLWEKGGRLFFSYKFPMLLPTTIDLPIVPIDDKLAVIPGKGSAFNETIQIERIGGVEQINFSGYLLEKKVKSGWLF